MLREGADKEFLHDMLDRMELRRVCIVKLCDLLGTRMPINDMGYVDSKAMILSRPACKYGLSLFRCQPDHQLRAFLENGSDPNHWDDWGQAIHYITRDMNREHSAASLDTLFSVHSSVPVVTSNNARYDRGETYSSGVTPQLYAMNAQKFCDVILLIANGDSTGEFCKTAAFNRIMSAAIPKYGGGDATLTHDIVMSTVKAQPFHVERLRKAYKYHKEAAAGMPKLESEIEGLNGSGGGTLGYCLFVLACVTGDLFPLTCYIQQGNTRELYSNTLLFLDNKREGATVTIRDFAILCGHKNVMEFLDATKDDLSPEAKALGLVPMERSESHEKVFIEGSPSSWTVKMKEFVVLAEQYINTELPQPVVEPNEEVALFHSMVLDVIQAIPSTSKHLGSVKRTLGLLNEAIEKGDTKLICRHFNTMNALLTSIKDLPEPYSLGEEVRNLIKDLQQ
jgi:hypothetical protein